MTAWRSSSLYTWVRTGCAATLLLERQGVPQDLQIFAVGEVAHLLLDAAARWNRKDPSLFGEARARKLRVLAESFLVRLPDWETFPKPPVGPDQAEEGLRLALDWIEYQGVPEGQSEIGLALGSDLETAVPYDSPEARWRGLVDSMASYRDFDEMTGEEFNVLRIDDYKSSWADTEALTLQRTGQALLAVAHVGELPDRLVLRTLNLRRRDGYVYTSEDVGQDLAAWRRRLTEVLRRADEAVEAHDVETAARPGAACLRCPYLNHCPPGGRFAGYLTADDYTVESHVATWGTAKAHEAVLFEGLKAQVDRAGGIVRLNGSVIRRGTHAVLELRESFAADLWRKWFDGRGDVAAVAIGLLERLGLRVSNVEAMIKTLDPMGRGAWRDWLQRRITTTSKPHGLNVQPVTNQERQSDEYADA